MDYDWNWVLVKRNGATEGKRPNTVMVEAVQRALRRQPMASKGNKMPQEILTIRADPAWVRALDEFCETQTVKPTRTEVIREAVRRFIASHGPGELVEAPPRRRRRDRNAGSE